MFVGPQVPDSRILPTFTVVERHVDIVRIQVFISTPIYVDFVNEVDRRERHPVNTTIKSGLESNLVNDCPWRRMSVVHVPHDVVVTSHHVLTIIIPERGIVKSIISSEMFQLYASHDFRSRTSFSSRCFNDAALETFIRVSGFLVHSNEEWWAEWRSTLDQERVSAKCILCMF